jgi:hypothetical protein
MIPDLLNFKMKNIVFILFTTFVMASPKDTLPSPNWIYSFKLPTAALEDCDSCGCSASGGSMGFASLLNSNFIGVRYFYQHYKTNDGLYSNSPWYDEYYQTTQLWTRIPITSKIQISAIVPYHFHQRQTVNGTEPISGLGDVTVMGLYQLYQSVKKDSTAFSHTLHLGGGVKAPTGTYDIRNNGSINPGYQLGTGSWDGLILTEYTLRKNAFGLNLMANYTIKSENDKGYRFGNQLNYGGTIFYLWERNQNTFSPQLGLNGEVYEFNFQHGQKVQETAGSILFSKIGFEWGIGKWSLGSNLLVPLRQNLIAGNVEAKLRFALNINYAL